MMLRSCAMVAAGIGLVAFATSALAKVTIDRQPEKTIYTFEVEKVDYQDVNVYGETFKKAILRGVEGYEGIVFEEGKPEIPVIRLVVDGNGDVKITADHATKRRSLLGHVFLQPALYSPAKMPGATGRLVFNQAAYRGTGEGKGEFDVAEIGTVRDHTRRAVTLFPLSYNPQGGWVTETLRFTVEVAKGTQADEDPRLPKGLAFVVGSKFENSPSLTRYMEFKRNQGFVVKTVVMGRDATNPDEIRAKLRALLRDAAAPLKAAIIVGDNEDVPGQPSTNIEGVTDHYYRAIDKDPYDGDIGTPDIMVGRFSVSTEQELAAVVDKNVKYSTQAFASRDWIRRFSWIASDDSSHWQIAEGTHNYAIDAWTAPKGYLGDWPANPQPGGDRLYAITHQVTDETVVQKIQAGRGLINYGGHGGEEYWVAPHVTKEDVLAMRDPNALPVVISNACVTGNFTVDSFGETWQRHPYGAVMYWGSMDSTYWDEDDILERRMYDAIFRDGKAGFAEFTDYALAEVWRYYGGAGRSKYYMETYVLFGDPTISMILQ